MTTILPAGRPAAGRRLPVTLTAPATACQDRAGRPKEAPMPVLAMTAEVRELRERVRDLMDRLVYPNEPRLDREDDEAEALVEELRAEVRAAGLWAPHIGP